MRLPKIIYIWRDASDENYLIAQEIESDLNEFITYGIYELKEVKKMIFERKPVKVKQCLK